MLYMASGLKQVFHPLAEMYYTYYIMGAVTPQGPFFLLTFQLPRDTESKRFEFGTSIAV